MNFDEIFLTTTDTVPGIGTTMTKANLEALYFLKDRIKEKKFIIMVGSIEQAQSLKGWSKKADRLAKKYWPGNVTLSLNEEMAVRMPNSEGLRNLIIKKGPVYMSSANKSGEDQISLEEAKKVFHEVKETYDFGEGSGIPSTIIRIKDEMKLR